MLVRDLIKELQKFPELSKVFVQSSDSDVIRRLDSTHEVFVRGDGILTEILAGETPEPHETVDYGVLIYG